MHITEFHIKGYNPTNKTDQQLADDWRLLCAKYSTMLDGGETEFDSIDSLLAFGEIVLKEILDREKMDFHYENMKDTSAQLLLTLLEELIDTILVSPKETLDQYEDFYYLKQELPDNILNKFHAFGRTRLLGFLRLSKQEGDETYEMNEKDYYKYKTRDYVLYPEPKKSFKNGKELRVFESLSDLPDIELIDYHARIHDLYSDSDDKEELIKEHAGIVDELKTRKMEHRPITELDRKSFDEEDHVFLKDIDLELDDFYLGDLNFALVGSEAVSGMGHDLDFWTDVEDPDLLGIIDFRLKTQLPPEQAKKVQLITGEDAHTRPFTNLIRVGRLKMEILPPEEQKLVRMAEALKNKQAEEMAKKSEEEDKVEPHRFYYPQKAIKGYRKREVYSIDSLLSVLREEEYPYSVDRKFDGLRLQVHKTNEGIDIWTEQGKPIKKKLIPETIEDLKQQDHEFVVEGEAELWIDEEHLGRSDTAGYINSDDYEKKSAEGFVINLFETLWIDGEDIHKKNQKERKEFLEQLDETDHINIAPYRLCEDEEELIKAVKHFKELEGSEGAMIKANIPYDLSGTGRSYTKFKNEVDMDVQVIKRDKVKGASAYTYDCAIKDKADNLIPIGTTYNIGTKAFEAKKGDIIRVAFVNLNRWEDSDTDKIYYNWWSPRPIELREDKDEPNTTVLANRIVKQTSGEVGEKSYSGNLPELLQESQFYFSEAEDFPKDYAVLELHARGKSVHGDLRIVKDGYWTGWTIFLQPEGEIKEDVNTVKQLKKLAKSIKWKFRPDMNPSDHVQVESKPSHITDMGWIELKNRVVEPGDPGATRFEEGVFFEVATGKAYEGADKPYFKEYFLDMDGIEEYKGRCVFRQVKIGEDVQWQTWFNMKTQEPYVLSRGARIDKEWIPPPRKSALPPEWEEKVPKDLRWWKEDLSKKERIKLANKTYNHLIEKDILHHRKMKIEEGLTEAKQTGNFALRKRSWMGQIVVRAQPVILWDILLNLDGEDQLIIYFVTEDQDPRFDEEVSITRELTTRQTPDGDSWEDWMSYSGKLPPEDPLNPNKELKAEAEIVDTGKVTITDKDKVTQEIEFEGDELDGTFTLMRESPSADFWILKR